MKITRGSTIGLLRAFSRSDILFAVSAFILLLFVIAVPMLQAARNKSHILQCQSNLAIVYKGLIQTRDSNTKRFPWQHRSLWGVPSPEKPTAVWFFMSKGSNYIGNPKVLVCPADKRKPVTDWSTNSMGLANAKFRDNAVSYFLAVDLIPHAPQQLFLGDRNIPIAQRSMCGHLFGAPLPVLDRVFGQQNAINWDGTNLHKTAGHLVKGTGEIKLVDSRGLNAAVIAGTGYGCFSSHFNFPEPNQTVAMSK